VSGIVKRALFDELRVQYAFEARQVREVWNFVDGDTIRAKHILDFALARSLEPADIVDIIRRTRDKA